ncbi:MAG: hypothetical protein LCH53_10125 [Bacteroidetes bacterium]|nr:hypothetical protein [Bacteroidota bacterium]
MKRLLLLPALLLAAPVWGQTFTGELQDSDPTRDGGNRYDAYTFTLRDGQQAKVRMQSDAFDTYLIVKGPDGAEFSNDDFEGTSVSQVEFVASKGGTWTVWASAFSDSGRGAYSVDVTPGKIAQIVTTEGRLDPRDQQFPKGEYYDLVEQRMGNTPFSVELVSYGFDGFLVAQSPSGRYYRNDDDSMGGGSMYREEGGSSSDGNIQRSALRDIQPEAGVWKIWVTTLGGDTYGAYDLRVLTFPD